MMYEQRIEIAGRFIKSTARAYLYEDENKGEEVWIPKSQAQGVHREQDRIEMTIPVWLAKKNGLV